MVNPYKYFYFKCSYFWPLTILLNSICECQLFSFDNLMQLKKKMGHTARLRCMMDTVRL